MRRRSNGTPVAAMQTPGRELTTPLQMLQNAAEEESRGVGIASTRRRIRETTLRSQHPTPASFSAGVASISTTLVSQPVEASTKMDKSTTSSSPRLPPSKRRALMSKPSNVLDAQFTKVASGSGTLPTAATLQSAAHGTRVRDRKAAAVARLVGSATTDAAAPIVLAQLLRHRQ